MTYETQSVNLRHMTADEGMVITDKATLRMRAKEIYLAKGERRDNFIEIYENTPVPESDDADITP